MGLTTTKDMVDLLGLLQEANKRYNALSPQQKAAHDHEQRRSWMRGMCPSNRNYDEWCKEVDRLLPPLSQPSVDAGSPNRHPNADEGARAHDHEHGKGHVND